MKLHFFLALLSVLQGLQGQASAECGVIPGNCQQGFARVAGGNVTPPHAYPHQVSIQAYDSKDNFWYRACDGSLVEADKVVTSGLCAHLTQIRNFNVSHLRVVGGDHNLYAPDGTEQCRPVKSLIVHPQFSGNQKLGYDYDYGVVRLADPFTLNAYVGTISVTKIEPEAGDCVTLGWGHIDDNNDIFFPCVLHHVAVPLVSSEKCEQIYQGKEIITKRMKCAGTAGKGFCINDNGGPLVCNGELAGIASRIDDSCPPPVPNVYANVATVWQWLNSQ